jgi:D-glycero-alpha-D-manno-heptose 1-phosphate guanylyltransferase
VERLIDIDVVVLAGGMGSRLGELSINTPKPMQKILDTPFLEYLLNYLVSFNFKRIILSVGYRSETIMDYFGDTYKDTKIEYSTEDEPMGTGGAIKKAMSLISSKEFFVLNGDSYLEHDFNGMFKVYRKYKKYVLSAVKLKDCSRYGALEVSNRKIVKFTEKNISTSGFINAGCYLLDKSILKSFDNDRFSFEEWMTKNIKVIDFYVHKSKKDFIDIGIPDDLQKAEIFF